jgi:hypothetical protein
MGLQGKVVKCGLDRILVIAQLSNPSVEQPLSGFYETAKAFVETSRLSQR